MTSHIPDERLHDWCDDRLDDEDARLVAAHVEACRSCGDRASELRALLHAAATAPEGIAPPHDLWPALRERIARGRDVPFPTPASTRGPWWSRPAPALAAAAVLVLVSAAATAWLVTPDPQPPAPRLSPVAATLPAGTSPEVALVITNYEGLTERLSAEFESVRHRLPLEAVHTVESNLAVIDSALAEIRAVLGRQPDNDALVALLTSTYRQKVSVLEHATESVS